MLRAPPRAVHCAYNEGKSYMIMCGRLLLSAHYVRRVMCGKFDYVQHGGPLCALTFAIIIIMCGIMSFCAHYVLRLMCGRLACGGHLVAATAT